MACAALCDECDLARGSLGPESRRPLVRSFFGAALMPSLAGTALMGTTGRGGQVASRPAVHFRGT